MVKRFRSVMRVLLVVSTMALVWIGATPHAVAQPATPEMNELSREQKELVLDLVEKGKEAYNTGDFEEATERFKRAHEIFPHPDLLYRIGLAYERLGEDREALNFYRSYVEQAEPSEERTRVQRMLPVIERRVGRARLVIRSEPPGAGVFLGNDPEKQKGETTATLPVGPGEYHIIVKKEGYETVEELVRVGAGETATLMYQLKRVPTPEAPHAGEARATPSSSNASAVFLTAAGVGLGIGSIVFFILYGERQAELNEIDERRRVVTRSQYNDLEAQRNIYLGVGLGTGVAAAICLVWSYVQWKDGTEQEAASLSGPESSGSPSVVFTDDGALLGWQQRF